ncbi:MAG: oligosaccharide flippase family protein [Crocinitomicaceae bacterium]|nr:oligosaccharide flippase family protein [Crocinitomicaceae bacterium]
MANPIKQLLGQTAVYGLSSIVGRLLNYLLVPLYTAVFANPSDYGVVSELYAWVAFLVVLLTFGMETSFFRFLQDKEDKEKVFVNSFLTVIGINVLFFAVLLFFNQNIADLMLYSDHNEYIILLGAIVCIDAVTALPLAKLRAENKAFQFAGIQLSSIGVNIILNLVFMIGLFDPARPEEGVLFILFANLFASLVKPLLLYKHFLHLRFTFDKVLAKEMLWYAFPLVIAGFAGIINETLDRILLKHLLYDGSTQVSLKIAEAQVGIYSACYKLAMLVTILLQAYRYAAEPFFFAQLKNQDKNKVYSKVMNVFIAMVCLVFLVVSLNIDFFKLFIRNEAYYVGLKVVPILLLANVFLGIYYNQSIWYKLSGQTKFGAFIAIGGAMLTVVLNVVFIPIYGYMASAWATLIVYASQMIASYLLGQKHYPIAYNLRKFALYLVGALLVYFIASFELFSAGIMKTIFNNTLILGYLLMVYKLEKSLFRKTA